MKQNKNRGRFYVPWEVWGLVMCFVVLFAMILAPELGGRSKVAGMQSNAISKLHGLGNVLNTYHSAKGVYPSSVDWSTVSVPSTFQTSSNPSSYKLQGYSYIYTLVDASHYVVHAIPLKTRNTAHNRSFYVDETRLMRHCTTNGQSETAGINDAPIDKDPLPCR